ncbi:hypothetical protein ACFCW6_00290 [Streptomyces sp. NPDC056333]|uniref:hypothetical protein n=1 Tax=Streptomyces sp. NPDC056333 TaxID=3345786 RepID=UPI0035D5505F
MLLKAADQGATGDVNGPSAAPLRTLADDALARVVSDESGLVSSWVAPGDGRRWRAALSRLRSVLAPPPPTIPLFDVEP